MDAGSNFTLKIAAKSLQIETWLLLTAYMKSLSRYSTLPLPTPYWNVPFSHNACVWDKQKERHDFVP